MVFLVAVAPMQQQQQQNGRIITERESNNTKWRVRAAEKGGVRKREKSGAM